MDTLIQIQEKLDQFFSYIQDENVLIISEDKAVLPFAYIFPDKEKKNYLISLAVDYPTAVNVAHAIFCAQEVVPLRLVGSFYISTDGKKYIDDEAIARWEIDNMELNKLTPSSQYSH